MDIAAIEQELRATHSELTRRLRDLTDFLGRCDLIEAHAYRVDPVAADDSDCGVGKPVDVIPVEMDTNPLTARAYLLNGLEALEVPLEANTRFVVRHPGLLHFQADAEEAELLITLVNQAKKRFHDAAKQVADSDKRFEVVHELFPGLQMLHATREVHMARAEQALSFRWSWANKPIARNATLASALNALRSMAESPPEHLPHDQWVNLISEEREVLRSLPGEYQIKRRYSSRTHPICNIMPIKAPGEPKRSPRQVVGALPLLVFSKTGSPLKITPLTTYDRYANTRAKRSKPQRPVTLPITESAGFYIAQKR